jgi:hypothetical protein
MPFIAATVILDGTIIPLVVDSRPSSAMPELSVAVRASLPRGPHTAAVVWPACALHRDGRARAPPIVEVTVAVVGCANGEELFHMAARNATDAAAAAVAAAEPDASDAADLAAAAAMAAPVSGAFVVVGSRPTATAAAAAAAVTITAVVRSSAARRHRRRGSTSTSASGSGESTGESNSTNSNSSCSATAAAPVIERRPMRVAPTASLQLEAADGEPPQQRSAVALLFDAAARTHEWRRCAVSFSTVMRFLQRERQRFRWWQQRSEIALLSKKLDCCSGASSSSAASGFASTMVALLK